MLKSSCLKKFSRVYINEQKNCKKDLIVISQCFDGFFRPDVIAKISSSLINLTLLALLADFVHWTLGLQVRLLESLLTMFGTSTYPLKCLLRLNSPIMEFFMLFTYFWFQRKCNFVQPNFMLVSLLKASSTVIELLNIILLFLVFPLCIFFFMY